MVKTTRGACLMKRKMLFLCFSLLLLVACSNEKEADELIEEVEEAHDDVSSVESIYKEVYVDEEKEFEEVFHFQEDEAKMNFKQSESFLYTDGTNYELDTPRDPTTLSGEEIATVKKEIEHQQEFHQNPISFYKQFDDKFADHFEIEDEEDVWTLTYAPDQEILDEFYLKYTEYMLEAMSIYDEAPKNVVSNLNLEDFSLEFSIDQETKQIERIEFTEDATFLVNDAENGLDRTLIYEFHNYDEAEDIEVPEDAVDITDGIIHHEDDESNPLEDAFDDVFGDRLEDNPELEEQATLYLEGLIQALVYQDVDKAVEVSEGAMDEEEADMQRSFFRDVYIENTEANMGDVTIDEEHLENLADAFLSAIGKTSYNIIATEYDGLDQVVVVLLEIEGIDDFLINQQTEEDMTEVLDENDDLSVDELVEKNLKILADNYEGYDELLEPIEMVVPILIEGEDDFYIEPDDFLQGFVQQ